MNQIYFLMVCGSADNVLLCDFLYSRVIGWFSSKEKAIDILEHNTGNIWEGYYDYAILEKVDEGLYPHSDRPELYKYSKEMNKYCRIELPKSFERFTNFTIG